jgi:shikimate 5-dehydrogenase/shikimate kinase
MKLILIGHRGTGKSDLLERMKSYLTATNPPAAFFDLDREIEFREGKTISQIFRDEGEERFRFLEVRVFQELLKENRSFVIALGAGFAVQEIPRDIPTLWVRRRTDILGRIFLNRPRLNREASPLEEYLQRLPFREERYQNHCTEQYLMPEGLDSPNPIEAKIFQKDFKNLGGVVTLLPQHFHNEGQLQERIRNLDCDLFELRDDLLSTDQIQKITGILPPRRVLLSLRKPNTDPWLKEFLRTGVEWDWALELGPCHWGKPSIYSLHRVDGHYLETPESLRDFLARFHFPPEAHIKFSPLIENFEQLKACLEWQQEKPDQRSLLPRSSQGIWHWVRLWLKGRQKINFFRLDKGSAPDQPTLYEWMATPFQPQRFAAVLGSPVFHSRTPMEHQGYFEKNQMPVFSIDLKTEDFPPALSLLQTLGLRSAAVTSPLKNVAYQASHFHSQIAKDLHSANTLFYEEGKWHCHNTDLEGFTAAMAQITGDASPVAVWGGGGTLPVIRRACPQAFCFSARTGELKREYGDENQWTRDEIVTMNTEGPRLLIWAAAPESEPPPTHWRPEFILDLNYREDSRAREYALQCGGQYLDGITMFKEQARGQREFWDRFKK